MATSAFKSMTKRASIGGSSSDDSSRRSLRHSRSLSQFSHPIATETEPDNDYNKNVPRGKFVNTSRGSTTPFPEISLDDLALEFFSSSSSSKNDNDSDGVVVERKEREGRSVSRLREMGRWAGDTVSSSRRGRSVSRTRDGSIVYCSSASGGKNVNSSHAGSRRRRSLSVASNRGDVVSSSLASGDKKVISSEAGSRRRRSLSVARFPISDSESELDHSRKLKNRANVKVPLNGNYQISSTQKTRASSTRRLGRSRSHKDIPLLHDGYSSHSSALTDEEAKNTHFGKNGFEKIIRPVYTQKAEHPTEDVANGGLYEAMRKELRYAVQEIRTELNQVMGKNHTALANVDCLRSGEDFCRTGENYATKLEQKHSDGSIVSEKLIDEAERYFLDFICNIEDTDISSFDGERSDGSSNLGGKMKEKDATNTCRSVESDGVILPWLQWETSHDGYMSEPDKEQTPKALPKDSEKSMVLLNDSSGRSMSSRGSWSPGIFVSPPPVVEREETCKTMQQICVSSRFDMDEHLKRRNNEELLLEVYRERNRISSGGMLLCTGGFY